MNNKLHRYMIPEGFVPPGAQFVNICIETRAVGMYPNSEFSIKLKINAGTNSLVIDENLEPADPQNGSGRGTFDVYLQEVKTQPVQSNPLAEGSPYEVVQGFGKQHFDKRFLPPLKDYLRRFQKVE